MNPSFAQAIVALVPTAVLLVGSTLQFSLRKRIATLFQFVRSSREFCAFMPRV